MSLFVGLFWSAAVVILVAVAGASTTVQLVSGGVSTVVIAGCSLYARLQPPEDALAVRIVR
jgi:hypothetical protein